MGQLKYKGFRNLMIILIIFISLFAVGLILMNLYSGYDLSGFYALLLICFTGIITCLVLIPLFLKRQKAYRTALNPATQFASWHLDEALLKATSGQKLKDLKERNKALLIVMTIFFGLFTFIFAVIIDSDSRFLFIAIMLITYGFIMFVGIYFPHLAYKRQFTQSSEVYLGDYAVIIGNEFHVFQSALSKYVSSEYNTDTQLLTIHYKSLNRTGWTPYFAQVPVPSAYEQTAYTYIEKLRTMYK